MSKAPPLANAAHEPPARGTALLVDDEPANLRLLESVLSREGFRCLTADNGERAIALYQEDAPDIVFMDVMMPGIDGYETTRRIKALAGERFVPVIFLTALHDSPALVRCTEAGGDDFITKPFQIPILKARIQAMERVRDLHRALRAQHEQLGERHARDQQEQALAERVYTRMITSRNVTPDGLDQFLRPAATFNGDLVLTAHLPDGGLRVLVADFTGHGLPAAIAALPVTEIFHAMTRDGADEACLLAALNQTLFAVLPTERFMAACIASIPASRHELRFWNGGMPPAVLSSPRGVRELGSRGLPLGIVANAPAAEELLRLPLAGDERLLLLSDGLLEAVNPAGAMFGHARLEALWSGRPAEDPILPDLIRALDAHCQDTPPHDDVTVVEIRIGPSLIRPSSEPQPDAHREGWRWSISLSDDRIDTLQSIYALLQPLHMLDGLEAHLGTLETIVLELYNNAIEHGILQLNSAMKTTPEGFEQYYRERAERLMAGCRGTITLELTFTPLPPGGQVTIVLSDSGDGFDSSRFNGTAALERQIHQPWGRGIALVRSLCTSLQYQRGGRQVEAVYRW